MARRSSAYPALYSARIDILPIVPVAIALSIFLYLASGIGGQTTADLDVSLSTQSDPAAANATLVAVAPDGQLRLNGRPVSKDELLVSLSTLHKKQNLDHVTLNTDPAASLQVVLDTMRLIQSAGVSRVLQTAHPQK